MTLLREGALRPDLSDIDPTQTSTSNLEHAQSIFNRNGLELITGTANPQLAFDIGAILERDVDRAIGIFDDGERRAKIDHNLRRKHAVIIQPTSPPYVNDYIMELLLMIDAARRASVGEITVVVPY